ncbi:hypothetical protein EON64_18450, partial [archaeon]
MTSQFPSSSDADYSYVELAAQTGMLQLLPEDATAVTNMLVSNTGSKDSIKAIRKWILDRAHSTVHIAHIVCEVVGSNTERGFDFVLRTLYVVNDVFYQTSSASSRGTYTTHCLATEQPVDIVRIFLPYVALVLQCVSMSAGAPQRDKLEKLLALWGAKGFLLPPQLEAMLGVLRQQPPVGFVEGAQGEVWSNAS